MKRPLSAIIKGDGVLRGAPAGGAAINGSAHTALLLAHIAWNRPIDTRTLDYRQTWSLAFYTYSHERYEPTLFPNGTFQGTPEEAFDVGAVYLQ